MNITKYRTKWFIMVATIMTGTLCLYSPLDIEAKYTVPLHFALDQSLHKIDFNQAQAAIDVQLSEFTDYRQDSWWTNTMGWGITKGIINGYTSTSGERTLQPNRTLTEAEYLTMLLRLLDSEALAEIEAEESWWAAASYQLAAVYNLPVKGGNDQRSFASQAITRGDTAVIMISGILGRYVSEREAVQYLYDHNLSTGRDPHVKTFASFGASDQLTRAEAVTFLQRLEGKNVSIQRVAEQNVVLAKLHPVLEQYQLTGKVIINHDVEIIDANGILISTYRGPNDLRAGHRVATYISRHENATQIMAEIAVILGVKTEANSLVKEINDYFDLGGSPRTFNFDGQQVEIFFGGSTNYITVAWE